MLVVNAVVASAAVVKVGETTDGGDVASGSDEQFAVTFHALLVWHPVKVVELPTFGNEFLEGFEVKRVIHDDGFYWRQKY